MKKKMLCLVLSVMVGAALTACGAKTEPVVETPAENAAEPAAEAEPEAEAVKEEAAPADTAEATERTKLVVGFDAEFPPYGFMDENGEYVGFDLDLAKEVCSRNGWEFVAQPIDWDSKDMELNSGSIDCIWNGFTMQGREEAYTWSVPYVDNSQVFVVPADAGITTFADLTGKVVGVQKDSSALHALEADSADLAATFKELQQYSDYNVAFMDLEQGAIEALAIDIGVAKYRIGDKADQFLIMEEQLASEQYGIGFKLGNEELKNQVEKTLLEMVDDGTFMKIADSYSDFSLAESVCLGK